ncbi:MAG: F0F1 ATP synthase subunit epsilon [Acidobacteria bacterium]|nr:MAG: F0F1 ATP synthase subunit epsilon [Acidobacteriota bacterium]
MALPTHLTLEIVTPERPLIREQVDEVIVPAADGSLGVLPGHTPLLARLDIGQLSYRKGQETFYLLVAFGFAEILPDRVTILAQTAEKAGEIDLKRAETARDRAQERLARPTMEMDFERARIAMMKALVRPPVASRARIRS